MMSQRDILREALTLYLGHQELTAQGLTDYGDVDAAKVKARIAEEMLNAA